MRPDGRFGLCLGPVAMARIGDWQLSSKVLQKKVLRQKPGYLHPNRQGPVWSSVLTEETSEDERQKGS